MACRGPCRLSKIENWPIAYSAEVEIREKGEGAAWGTCWGMANGQTCSVVCGSNIQPSLLAARSQQQVLVRAQQLAAAASYYQPALLPQHKAPRSAAASRQHRQRQYAGVQ
jgi:hypothetical protein